MIIEDTRNKTGKHENKHAYWNENGVIWARSALLFGDYWPTPKTAVDTKQGVQEIALNLCGAVKEKRRFDAECKLARDAGTKLVFLIEETAYNVPEDLCGRRVWLHNGQTVPGDQIYLAMRMHEERYGCEFWFCDPDESGRVIQEILNNDR